MYSRCPADKAKRGKFSVLPQRVGYVGLLLLSVPLDTRRLRLSFVTAVTKSIWPMTTSAACPFCVGIEFQINTRLKPRSETNMCVPSAVTAMGESSVLGPADIPLFVRSSPRTLLYLAAPLPQSPP